MPMPKLIPRLYVYYVVHDKGVAPNPDGDMLTLALCKKDIRRCANPGDIIIGLVGRELASKTKEGVTITENNLCFFARIDEKLSFMDYAVKCHRDDELGLKAKIPNFTIEDVFTKDTMLETSSNINGDCILNKHGDLYHYSHSVEGLDGEVQSDLDDPYVLCSKNFFYFGDRALNFSDKPEIHDWYKRTILDLFDDKSHIGCRKAYFEDEEACLKFFEHLKRAVFVSLGEEEKTGKIGDPAQDLLHTIQSCGNEPLTLTKLEEIKSSYQLLNVPCPTRYDKPSNNDKVINKGGNIVVFKREAKERKIPGGRKDIEDITPKPGSKAAKVPKRAAEQSTDSIPSSSGSPRVSPSI